MIRNTSVAAYQTIKANGLLSRMRWRVYDCLYHHGPLTSREVDRTLSSKREERPSYHKRLSELESLGVVVIVGERKCSVTHNMCKLWDVTPNLPTKQAADRLVRVDMPLDSALQLRRAAADDGGMDEEYELLDKAIQRHLKSK